MTLRTFTPAFVNVFDPCAPGATPHLGDERIERSGRALGLHLDTAVATVANDAAHAVLLGPMPDEPAEPDTLHPSRNEKIYTLHVRENGVRVPPPQARPTWGRMTPDPPAWAGPAM